MSPSRNRTPSKQMPAFSQELVRVDAVAGRLPARPIVFETISPKTMAHRTYSMLGSVRLCAFRRPSATVR